MEFDGKCIMVLDEKSGVSKAGKPWKKKEWIFETFGTYPRKVKIQAFGDRADQFNFELNQDYRLQVDAESREFNGNWYTDISVYGVQPLQGAPAPAPAQYGAAPAPAQPTYGAAPAPAAAPAIDPFAPSADTTDDLPF